MTDTSDIDAAPRSGHPKIRVEIPVHGATLDADWFPAQEPVGVVLFSHGSGSSHLSPRNRFVASYLANQGFHCLLSDLLTPEEDRIRANRFDIDLLTTRLLECADWAFRRRETDGLPACYFGASTGAASALLAVTRRPNDSRIRTVVCRGGRPDLAMEHLDGFPVPVLLLVGELDFEVLRLNRLALRRLPPPSTLHVVPGASHLFEEPGALEQVARTTGRWLHQRFGTSRSQAESGSVAESNPSVTESTAGGGGP